MGRSGKYPKARKSYGTAIGAARAKRRKEKEKAKRKAAKEQRQRDQRAAQEHPLQIPEQDEEEVDYSRDFDEYEGSEPDPDVPQEGYMMGGKNYGLSHPRETTDAAYYTKEIINELSNGRDVGNENPDYLPLKRDYLRLQAQWEEEQLQQEIDDLIRQMIQEENEENEEDEESETENIPPEYLDINDPNLIDRYYPDDEQQEQQEEEDDDEIPEGETFEETVDRILEELMQRARVYWIANMPADTVGSQQYVNWMDDQRMDNSHEALMLATRLWNRR
jgi:hypothetical protein